MERAVDWLFNHPEAGLDFVEDSAAAAAAPAPAAAPLAFPVDAAPKLYQLFAFILHKGNQIGSGEWLSPLSLSVCVCVCVCVCAHTAFHGGFRALCGVSVV